MMVMEYINRETGVEPDIAEGVLWSGVVDCIDKVTIEKDVMFGHNIALLTGSHDYTKFGQERKGSTVKAPIHIKEGAWICSFATVLQGVTIGKHSVIGAGSVVTKDVPDYQVWAGVPARFIKEIPHQ
jgi:acetyltransferase-like isoleucine patch superfamily enzyme